MCRALLLVAALLASANAGASRQTHELIRCAKSVIDAGQPMKCYGSDQRNPVYENVEIQDLYRDGWRLIAVEPLSNGNTRFFLERPITPTAE